MTYQPIPGDLREARYLMVDILELLARYNKLTGKSVVIHDPSEVILPEATDEVKESTNVRKSNKSK